MIKMKMRRSAVNTTTVCYRPEKTEVGKQHELREIGHLIKYIPFKRESVRDGKTSKWPMFINVEIEEVDE